MTTSEPGKRDAKGRFVPGPRAAGRRKGSVNKATADIKQCFIEAAQRIGSDGKGRGGVRGFIEKTGRANPEALMIALSRFVPPPPRQNENAIASIGVVNVVAVPTGKYLSAEDVRATIDAEYAVIEKPKDEDAA